MVYKTKKINRRRYLKKQSKRKMYGGYPENNTVSQPLTNAQLSVSQPLTNAQPLSEEPSLQNNFKKVGNLIASGANKVGSYVLDEVAEKMGVDPNKPAIENITELDNSIKKIVAALNSPEGEELKRDAGELLADSIDVVKPSIEKAEQILEDGINKLTKTGASAVMTAVNEFPPMFAVSEVSKAVTAVAQAGETVAKLTNTSTEAYENLQEQREKASSLWNNLSTGVNKGVSNIINTAQEHVDNFGQTMSQTPELTSSADETLKKYRNEGKMIGGRIRKSQLEFLSHYTKRHLHNTKRKLTRRRQR